MDKMEIKMNKKTALKILLFILVCIASVAIALRVDVVSRSNVKLSFVLNTDYGQTETYQVFYVYDDVSDMHYTEVNKVEVDANNGDTITLELPNDISGFRIDFGSGNKSVNINGLSLGYGSDVLKGTGNAWQNYYKINDIEELNVTDNNLSFKVVGQDPYVAWDINEWNLADTIEKKDKLNIIAKAIVILLLWVMYFAFLHNFDNIIEFPAEIYQCRALVLQLAKNDFMTRYAGSVFGIFWAFVQPVITVLIYWFVFEKGFRNGPVGDTPFVLWMISGLVPWFFFSDAVNGGTDALLSYNYLVKKVVFRIDILPLVKIFSAGFIHLFFVGFTLVLFICYGRFPGVYILQLIYYSLCTLLLALGIAYATSAIVGFFRDLTQIINIILMIGIWLTPIMWNFDTIVLPGWIKTIFMLNPVFYIVQGYRDSLINHIWFWQRPAITIYFWMIMLSVLGIGTVIFKKLKVHFADVL